MSLADRAGLASERVRITDRCGVNAAAKIGWLIAGTTGGADSMRTWRPG